MAGMTDRITCSEADCSESIPNHRWGKTRADGWFLQKSGEAWCPAHTPAWVGDWRRRKAAK